MFLNPAHQIPSHQRVDLFADQRRDVILMVTGMTYSGVSPLSTETPLHNPRRPWRCTVEIIAPSLTLSVSSARSGIWTNRSERWPCGDLPGIGRANWGGLWDPLSRRHPVDRHAWHTRLRCRFFLRHFRTSIRPFTELQTQLGTQPRMHPDRVCASSRDNRPCRKRSVLPVAHRSRLGAHFP